MSKNASHSSSASLSVFLFEVCGRTPRLLINVILYLRPHGQALDSPPVGGPYSSSGRRPQRSHSSLERLWTVFLFIIFVWMPLSGCWALNSNTFAEQLGTCMKQSVTCMYIYLTDRCFHVLQELITAREVQRLISI